MPILAGCWSSQELNDFSIVMALGIDKQEEQYLLTAQIINPGQIASTGGIDSSRTAINSYQVTSETLYEGIRKLTDKVPKDIYVSHLRMAMIGEELARNEGIGKVLEYLSRDHAFRTDFFIVIAQDTTAKTILDILTPMEKIPAQKMFSSLEASHFNFGATVPVTLDELIIDLVSKGKQPVLSGIHILGDPESGKLKSNVENVPAPTEIVYSSTAAFKGDRLVDWLNESESRGYNFITDNIINAVINISCPNEEEGKITLELDDSTTSLKGSVHNQQPKLEVNVEANGDIGEVMCGVDLVQGETFEQIEKLTEDQIKNEIASSIETAQTDFESDIFGFGEVIHRHDPASWESLKDNWDEVFSTMEFNINVQFKIRQTGTLGDSFIKEMEE